MRTASSALAQIALGRLCGQLRTEVEHRLARGDEAWPDTKDHWIALHRLRLQPGSGSELVDALCKAIETGQRREHLHHPVGKPVLFMSRMARAIFM